MCSSWLERESSAPGEGVSWYQGRRLSSRRNGARPAALCSQEGLREGEGKRPAARQEQMGLGELGKGPLNGPPGSCPGGVMLAGLSQPVQNNHTNLHTNKQTQNP